MLEVSTRVAPSVIHGLGLFAYKPIPKGTLVWRFRFPDHVTLASSATNEEFIHGYINPRRPEFLVHCGDDARFINFSDHPSLQEVIIDGRESDLIAAEDIPLGAELTVSPSTDADYEFKMGRSRL